MMEHMNSTGSADRGAFLAQFRVSPLRHYLLLAIDAGLAALSLWFALELRFDWHIRAPYSGAVPGFMAILVFARVAANSVFRVHRWSFRFSSLDDSVRVVLAGLLGTGVFLLGILMLRFQTPPRSVVVLEFFFSTAAMGALRFSPRLGWSYLADRTRARRNGKVRTLIVGAGVAGDLLLRDLQRSDEHNFQVIGFVDDDRRKWATIVGGRPVLGGIGDLPALAEQHRIANVLIAIPRLGAERVREILAVCADLKLRFKMLPVSYAYLHDRAAETMLQDLSPEDLLTREAVSFPDTGESGAVRGRRVMVTGAAGSIGSEICVQLARAGVGHLVMADVNESGLYMLKRRLEREHPDVSAIAEVADIRDERRMHMLADTHRPLDVFHAAAHKHVPLMEAAPCEAVKNNVVGTLNVALAASQCGIERFVYISTDKAVRPTSVMGATKRVGEVLVRAMGQKSSTRFCAVRFGNVLGSAGSVVPIFREQISAGGPVTVTHPEVRRYFMAISEAVGLVLQAAYGDFGELCVLEMGEQIRIADLARHMITMVSLAPDVDIPIVYTGLRPGEKLSEDLLDEDEEHVPAAGRKILVVKTTAPTADFDKCLAELAAAGRDGDAVRVTALLRRLVPTYRPMPVFQPAKLESPEPRTPAPGAAAKQAI
jgi:FlaA1/EpsC-like NDP-sugar epimerase